MQGSNRNFQEILSGANRYVIPAYQRDYQWDEQRWQSLVSDVVAAKRNAASAPKHWMGIFLISQSQSVLMPGHLGQLGYTVIDGQQRLVTLMLWIAALAHHGKDKNPGFNLDLSSLASIEVQDSDKAAFDAVFNGYWEDPAKFPLFNHNIVRAYSYFRYLLHIGSTAVELDEPLKFKMPKKPNNEVSFTTHWDALIEASEDLRLKNSNSMTSDEIDELINATMLRLNVYTLIHEPNSDESQATIFDTLNGMRQELEPLDHVRNTLFVRIPDIEAKDVYSNYWRSAEDVLRKARLSRKSAGKAFIYDFLISQGEKKRQGTIKTAKGSVHFNTLTSGMDIPSLTDFIKNVVVPSMLVWPVAVREKDDLVYDTITHTFEERVLRTLSQIKDMNDGPTNPLVMLYLSAKVRGLITNDHLYDALVSVEAYVARQILGGRPMSPLRSRIMDIAATIDKELSLDLLRSTLLNSDWVTDQEILGKAKTNTYEDLSSQAKGAILRGIERSLSGDGYLHFKIGNADHDYSIEHIYPQKPQRWLPDLVLWRQDQARMDAKREAIGNLTAATMKHNKAVGNKKLADKQAYPTQTGNVAPLSLNAAWLNAQQWTELEIDKRSLELVKKALLRWQIR